MHVLTLIQYSCIIQDAVLCCYTGKQGLFFYGQHDALRFFDLGNCPIAYTKIASLET